MTDINLDAMTRDELKEQAGVLDIAYAPNITDEKLREKIREALGETPQVEAVEPIVAPAKSKGRMYRGQIHKDGKDKQPVPVAVNGHVWRIMRGETVTIPEAHYHVLQNAVQAVWDDDAGEMIEVPAYPNSFQPVEG
jgi:hypothetical protein